MQLFNIFGGPRKGEDVGIINSTFQASDRPSNQPFADQFRLDNGSGPITNESLQVDFNLYFAMSTLDHSNNANAVYTALADAHWNFNGSGTWARQNNTFVWNPIAGVTKNAGDNTFAVGTATVLPVTTGAILNQHNYQWSDVRQT